VLTIDHEFGSNVKALPLTGNTWPSAAGSHGTAVYANPGAGEVYIRDDYIRQQGSALTEGSEPALSPAQDEDIVFVRAVDGHDHLFVERSTGGGPTYTDLTPHATTDYAEPAWSPDGKTIAARTPDGVVTLRADGSAAPVKVSGYHGLPAYRAS
jgi:Tol biopolymer transport system component